LESNSFIERLGIILEGAEEYLFLGGAFKPFGWTELKHLKLSHGVG
jgi:hypothetical protein